MQDIEIIGMLKTYISKTLVGMGALKGAPCTVQGVVDEGDGTQTLTLEWTDTNGDTHTTDITLPAAIFNITNPTNGQTIRYNGTSGKWENSNVSFSADLGDLDDVVITSVQDGQVLTYDAANNRWINADGSTVADLGDLTDVRITTVQNGQLLSYDSTSGKWVNITLDIDDLGNVSVSSATDGQILTYNGTSGKWENKSLDIDATDIDYDGTTSGLIASNVQSAIDELSDEKVDKVTGKGLSTNDFTDALKNKLDGIEDNAEVNAIGILKVNGTALTPDADKAVNIQLAIDKLSDVDLTSLADGYILIYDSTTQKWIAEANTDTTYTAGDGIDIDAQNVIKVVDRLIVTDTMPTASADYVGKGKQRLFVGTTTQDYTKGGIYDCQAKEEGGVTVYEWVSIGAAEVDLTDYKKIFNKTSIEWEQLSTAQKIIYDLAMFSDDADNGDIADVVESGNQNPVESDAVFDSEQEIYEVMGRNGAKNLLDVGESISDWGVATNNGLTPDKTKVITDRVTATVDRATGAVNVTNYNNSGYWWATHNIALTKNTNYKLYPHAKGPATKLIGIKNGVTTTISEFSVDTILTINSGDYDSYYVAFYPYEFVTSGMMVTFAADTSETFEPFAQTNQELTEAVQPVPVMLNNLGAKNLVPVTYDSIKAALATSSIVLDDNNQAVKNGVTLTVVLDSKGNVAKCNVNGTASADTYFRLWLTPALNSFGSDALNSILNPTRGSYTISSGTDSEGVAFVYQPNISNEYSGFFIRIDNGKTVNADVYPMLRYASITDDTYQPYAKTNQELTKDSIGLIDNVNKNGCKNLLKNNLKDIVQTDGTVTVSDTGVITVNGTVELGEQNCVIHNNSIGAGDYILSDGNDKDINNNLHHRMYYRVGSGSSTRLIGNAKITVSSSTILKLWIYIDPSSHGSYSNEKYCPMLRLASSPDDTYVPYAMSNREITEKLSGNTIIVENGQVDVKASTGTVADLLYSLSTAIGNVLSSMADNETLEVYRINIQSHANIFPQLKTLTNQSYADFYGIAIESTATTCNIFRLTLEHSAASNNKLRQCHLESNGTSFLTPSDESITAERTYTAYYRKFRKI